MKVCTCNTSILNEERYQRTRIATHIQSTAREKCDEKGNVQEANRPRKYVHV
jgi:hypothetical protein